MGTHQPSPLPMWVYNVYVPQKIVIIVIVNLNMRLGGDLENGLWRPYMLAFLPNIGSVPQPY